MAAKKTVVKKVEEPKKVDAPTPENYEGAEFTVEVLHAEMTKRGFDEADFIDLEIQELRDQLILDDAEKKLPTTKAPAAPEKGASAKKVGASDSLDIVKGDEYIRTFSEEVHGEDFKEIANQFVAKDARRSVCTFPIRQIHVVYRVQDKRPGENQGAWITKTNIFTSKEEAVRFRSQLNGEAKPVMLAKA